MVSDVHVRVFNLKNTPRQWKGSRDISPGASLFLFLLTHYVVLTQLINSDSVRHKSGSGKPKAGDSNIQTTADHRLHSHPTEVQQKSLSWHQVPEEPCSNCCTLSGL